MQKVNLENTSLSRKSYRPPLYTKPTYNNDYFEKPLSKRNKNNTSFRSDDSERFRSFSDPDKPSWGPMLSSRKKSVTFDVEKSSVGIKLQY